MQEFYLTKGSLNPYLRMEVFQDGRYDFKRSMINNALQDCTVKFSMKDVNTGILKVANADAEVVLAKTDSCEERYIIQYKWKERDVRQTGTFEGWFDINFNGNLSEEGIDYPKGPMRVPIQEELLIIIK